MFKILVPASSANLGPGFDVLGVSLSLNLEISVCVDKSVDSSLDRHSALLSYEGDNEKNVPLETQNNLVTQTALYVMRCNNVFNFPKGTKIHVKNPIPLGRGLGSSAAAIVGGAMLGNEIAGLSLSKERLLDYCLLIERHPDNIAAAMLGGFVGSYLLELLKEETERKDVPLQMILPKSDQYMAIETREPPQGIGKYVNYGWNKRIKCVVVIPEFEVKTDDARAVLPKEYSKEDVIFNLQRLAVLTVALGQNEVDHKLIFQAVRDRIHQPYRTLLVPGLEDVVTQLTPEMKGLCGVCLSGAGPTILCLATENFDEIGEKVTAILEENGIKSRRLVLDVADGAIVQRC